MSAGRGPDGERPDLTPLEARVVDAVDVQGLVEATCALVRIPSWQGNETPAQERMAEWMAGSDLEVDRWEIDLLGLARDPWFSAEIERERALGVVGTLRGAGGGRSLILNGHVDVVPPGDPGLWSHAPFAGDVAEGRIRGRGALDMKGGLLAGLFALRALRSAGVRPAGDVHLQSVVGEEDGGLGTLAAIRRGYRADGAVVLEPTGGAVAPAQAGALNFRVRVHGRAAHGALREEGRSAIDDFLPVYRALLELESRRNSALRGDPLFAAYRLPFPICVGTIRGGDWASSVPDHLTFEGRFGVAPGEDLDEARRALEETVRSAWDGDGNRSPAQPGERRSAEGSVAPPDVEWWGGRFTPARTATDHPLVTLLVGAAGAVTGSEPPVRGMTYGADMGLLVHQGGVATVLFGPGDIRRAHRPDEWLGVEELVEAARTLAVGMLRFCGAA